jgi:hypothetical protein
MTCYFLNIFGKMSGDSAKTFSPTMLSLLQLVKLVSATFSRMCKIQSFTVASSSAFTSLVNQDTQQAGPRLSGPATWRKNFVRQRNIT